MSGLLKMKILSFILFLAFEFTYSKPNGSRIISGDLARTGQFPYQAGIYVDTADGQYFCGGSLLDQYWIITAGHCLYNARGLRIRLGSNNLEPPEGVTNIGITASSSYIVVHPDFNPTTLEHDIGLLRLNSPVSFGQYLHPVTLIAPPAGHANEGTVATVSGWGQTSDSSSGLSNDLYYVTVAVISNEECKLTYGDQIKDTMVCTQGNGNEGICLGDTGGPLIAAISGVGEEILIGVAGFFSQAGCETLHPSGYVRVESYIDWIQSTLQSV